MQRSDRLFAGAVGETAQYTHHRHTRTAFFQHARNQLKMDQRLVCKTGNPKTLVNKLPDISLGSDFFDFHTGSKGSICENQTKGDCIQVNTFAP